MNSKTSFAKGQLKTIVERIERLVHALYDVSDDLTEEVVAHAVARADSSTPTDS